MGKPEVQISGTVADVWTELRPNDVVCVFVRLVGGGEVVEIPLRGPFYRKHRERFRVGVKLELAGLDPKWMGAPEKGSDA